MKRFTKDAKRVVEAAVGEANRAGSTTVEAEHLLLALARRGQLAVGADRVEAALAAEREASLATAGVHWDAPSRRRVGSPRFAASAKLALERSLRAAVARRDRRITGEHLLAGVLEARVGTVPRALALAGIELR